MYLPERATYSMGDFVLNGLYHTAAWIALGGTAAGSRHMSQSAALVDLINWLVPFGEGCHEVI